MDLPAHLTPHVRVMLAQEKVALSVPLLQPLEVASPCCVAGV